MRLPLLLALLFLSPAFLTAGDVRPVHRFGLFVGANEGQAHQPRLRWAIADAQKMASIMIETGGIERGDATVLGQPSAAEFLRTLASLRTLIRDTKSKKERVEFYFYYSGHSDERGLLVGGDRVLYTDLRSAITGTEADVNVAILDSCDSGAFTRAKGGDRVQPFLNDLSSETTGYAFLTSSSESEASQESDQLRGSFFTYYLINGLRGAADTTGNKRVTLNQAYQYAFRETLAQTEGTSIGAQHASYDFQLKGSGDLVIVDLANRRSSVLLDPVLSGRFFIRDQRGVLVSELQKEGGTALTIAIPSGSYTIRQQTGGILNTARITVTEDSQTLLTKDLFVSEAAAVNRARGEDDQTPRALRFFDLQVIPNFESLADEDTALSIGLVGARVDGVRGTQVSSVASFADKTQGTQAAGALAVAGPVTGFQAAGAVTIAGDVNGWQVAGAVSIAKNVVGVQSSVVTVAGSVDGVQVGVVNLATTIRGIQVGVFNYADDAEGIPIGVVSWITHGIHELTVGYDAGSRGTFVRWVGGSRVFWTSLEFGLPLQSTSGHDTETWFDVGLGYRFETDRLGFDLGAGLKQLSVGGSDPTAGIFSIGTTEDHLEMIPHLDALIRYNLGDRWALWAGPRLDLVDSRLVSLDRYADSQNTIHLWDLLHGVSSISLSFSAGVTFKL